MLSGGNCWAILPISLSSPAPNTWEWLARICSTRVRARARHSDDEDRTLRVVSGLRQRGETIGRPLGDEPVDPLPHSLCVVTAPRLDKPSPRERVRFGEAGERLIEAIHPVEQLGAREAGGDPLVEGAAGVRKRQSEPLKLACVRIRATGDDQAPPRLGRLGIDLKRPFVAGDRIIEFAERTVGPAEAGPARGELWIERDRMSQRLDSRRCVPGAEQIDAERAPGVGVPRTRQHDPLLQRDRVHEARSLDRDDGERLQGLGEIRPPGDSFAQTGLGFRQAPQAAQRGAGVQPRLGHAGLKLDCALSARQRLGKGAHGVEVARQT